MKKKWGKDRIRLILTLELAVTLPAFALIVFNLWNLRSIHRDKAIEAAIRHDFDQVLAIAEKRINEPINSLVESVRQKCPFPTDPVVEKLDRILADHPFVAHVFFYDAEKFQEYYQIIRKESDRLTVLINNILDFSRIDAGHREYDFHESNLADLVRMTIESYRYQIEQQGFVFEQWIADDIPLIWVDPEALARSLLNLINNALKYSLDKKYLRVQLYCDKEMVRLEVIDHGIGIPHKEQGKIFEKFYRVGDPLVHNTKGSGLGLSLVQHIVQAHGGHVLVESTPGKGSKFTISLPVDGGTLYPANA
jgi:signal transduction histidine kinase